MDFNYQKSNAKNMFNDMKNSAKNFDTDKANTEFKKFASKMGNKFADAKRNAER